MTPFSTPTSTASARSRIMLQLLGTAQGDPAIAESLRMLLWQAYQEADCPYGASEEGMFLWWDSEQQTVLN